MRRCRMLLEGHPKELLVKLGCTLDVGDPHGNVIQADGAQARWLWRGLCACDQCRKGSGELSACQAPALEISEHSFNDELHACLLESAMPPPPILHQRIVLQGNSLEHELKADLQLPHADVGVEAGNRAEAAATRYRHAAGIQMVGSQPIVWAAKVGMIKGIEGIQPQLQPESFGESHILLEGEIHTEQWRADHRVPSHVSEHVLRLQSKGLHIKPFLWSGVAELR